MALNNGLLFFRFDFIFFYFLIYSNICIAGIIQLSQNGYFQQQQRSGNLCNNETEFDCGYNEGNIRKCIPVEWLCDNVIDCIINNMDESMCRYVHHCNKGMLLCRNGLCVDSSFKCNGFDDCGDGSDERGCFINSEKREKQCAQGTFRCKNGPCITMHAKCDAINDCPEGDDEQGCPTQSNRFSVLNCAENQFMCDHQCIPGIWRCDGLVDCDDGTDEDKEVCAAVKEEQQMLMVLPNRNDYHSQMINQSICGPSQFLCEIGKCIPKEKVCDSRLDCPKGNDEGGHCGECSVFGCSHHCVDSPDGARCECPEKYHLLFDGRTCEKINECETAEGKKCSQKCVNRGLSFICECMPGYDLGSDGHSCHAISDPYSAVFFSLGSEVRIMRPHTPGSLVGYGVFQHNDKEGTVVRSISFNPKLNKLYMAVSNSDRMGHIHSSFGGLQQCVVDRVMGIANVAVDWITNNIYYTSHFPSRLPGVSVCTWDGRFCRILIKGTTDSEYYRRQGYRGLVLNPEHGTMFWIDDHRTTESPKIMTADMDGSNVRALISSKLEQPQGLAIDYIRQKLYFADIELQLIERVDIVTRDRATVAHRGVHHPYELAFFDDYIYWTDWSTEAVVASKVGLEELPHVSHSVDQMPYGIAVNHSVLWDTKVINPCDSVKCNQICVLSKRNNKIAGKCICPNRYFEDKNGFCMPLNETELAELEYGNEVPIMCSTLMVEYCETGKACLNGGTCQKELNTQGQLENIFCICPEGYAGQFCEVSESSTANSLRQEKENGVHVALILLPFIVLLALLAAYIISKYTSVENFVHSFQMQYLWYMKSSVEEEEGIVKPGSMVYQTDGFNNPVYTDSPKEDKTVLFTGGGSSPTCNTLPEDSIIRAVPLRSSSSPRFTLGP